jgi:hypothetical protein
MKERRAAADAANLSKVLSPRFNPGGLYMKKCLLLILIFLSSCSTPYPYRLAVCAIFKDEAPWLKEWLTYHHDVLGVDHFYLYNNESSDDYLAVLQPFVDQGLVDLIDWDSQNPAHLAYGPFMDAPWSAAQLGAYNHCLQKRALGKAQWVAMIDIDEFIVPANGINSFYRLLQKAYSKGRGTVSLQWRMFGTSDVEELAPGEKLTEKLVWRANDDHYLNRHFKSIHRPEAVKFCLVAMADQLNQGYSAETVDPNQVCIHHYWARTNQFCVEKRKISKESDPKFFADMHQVEDRTILQYSR